MIDHESVTENTLQTRGELGSKGYLRHEVQHILTLLQLRLNEMDIDIGLTGRSDAMEEHNILAGSPKSSDGIDGFGLCGG